MIGIYSGNEIEDFCTLLDLHYWSTRLADEQKCNDSINPAHLKTSDNKKLKKCGGG